MRFGSGLGLEEVVLCDSKSEKSDRAVELELGLGLPIREPEVATPRHALMKASEFT